ncbi:prepilin-type cleavage/methylation domain-containing protein [Acaryochloris sp. IP29b_bin.137]|uniref:PulJ/GspJ family protein n=1 Tax=Acaryochloris sp. IP29b_bin.137 TaxID=2969217 RepID=UPI00262536B2|nr:prepilin-type cleavage/methylation domain-containing protein [Acaryochloris sp. IP29b_bin.137]
MNNNHLKRYLQHNYPKSKGFTLPELLVAGVISLGVITVGGFGLVSILSSSQIANAQNERRVELNRSLDFIAAEIRQADDIVQDASNEPKPSEFNTSLPSGAQPVLMLKMPDLTGVQTPIIYYVASSTNNTWLGPKLIYRWGPKYNNDGTYIDPSNSANWSHEPLIDSIQNTTTTPTCSDSNWTANGNIGFGACVNATGKITELFHTGVFDRPIQGTEEYQAQTTVLARPSATSSANPNNPNLPGNSGVPPLFELPGDGSVVFNDQASLSIRVLGGEISCNPDGSDPIPTTAVYNLVLGQQVSQVSLSTNPPGSQSNIPVEAQTVLTVDGASTGGPCNINISANSQDDNLVQVLTLKNGDSIPDFAPFGNQRPIADFLDDYVDVNQKITIEDNEVIVLFELGSTNSGDSSFDMQDLVVLFTSVPQQQ